MSSTASEAAKSVPEAQTPDPALQVFLDDVKASQTVFLGIKVGKGKDYLRVNKSDVMAMATKHGVPATEVRGKFLFIHP